MADTLTYNGGRYYIVKEKNATYYLPSVTTVIGEYEDKSWIQDWYDRVGEENAKAIAKFSANRGTVMHMYCEFYFTDYHISQKQRLVNTLKTTYEWAVNEGFTEDEITVGRNLFYNFYNDGIFKRVDSIVMLEQRLYSLIANGYAGRVDKIYRNSKQQVVIADYKSSKKPKDESYIEGYKKQIAAYYVAYWEMFKIKPSHGEIWISNEQYDEPQLYIVTYNDIKIYYKKFLDAVKHYHKKYGTLTHETVEKLKLI